MGIYIKGMDMPTNCTDCRYRSLVGCNPYQDNGLSPSDHRHRTCPLTEVAEPHGRLIDADALIAKVKPHIDNTCKFLKPKELVQYINELSTIQAEINCVHCPHYYETEDDSGVEGHCRMDRPNGEWVAETIKAQTVAWQKVWYRCTNCNCHEYRCTKYCPNCGASMEK